MVTNLPPWCGDFQSPWPWQCPQGGLALVTLTFSTEGVSEQDFDRYDIPVPRSIRQSIAKRQAEYLAGRACASEALRRSVGFQAAPHRNEDGTPAWPAGSTGSISHTHGYAAAIAGPDARYRSIGMDLERLVRDDAGHRLIGKVLTPDEQSRFRAELTGQPGKLVNLAFSLKESLFKALYPLTGKRFYFQDAELTACQPDGTASLRLLTDLSAEWTSGTDLKGYYAHLPDHTLSLIPIAANRMRGRDQNRG